jgi:hypothetical protein
MTHLLCCFPAGELKMPKIQLPTVITGPGIWLLDEWKKHKSYESCGLQENSLCLLLGGSSATELALGKALDTANSDIDFYFQGKDELARRSVDCMREVVGSKVAQILGYDDWTIKNWKTKYTDNLDSSKSYYLIAIKPIDYNIGSRIIYSNFQISIDVETGLRVYDPTNPNHEQDFARFEQDKEIITYKMDELIANADDQKGFSVIAFVFKSYIKHVQAGCHFSEETAEAIYHLKKYNSFLMKAIEQRIYSHYGIHENLTRAVFKRAEENHQKNQLAKQAKEREIAQRLEMLQIELQTKDEKHQEASKEHEKMKEKLTKAEQETREKQKALADAKSLLGNVKAQSAKKETELETELEKQKKLVSEYHAKLEKMNQALRQQIEKNVQLTQKLTDEIATLKAKSKGDSEIGARIVTAVYIHKTQEKTTHTPIDIEELFKESGNYMLKIEENLDQTDRILFSMARESLGCIRTESDMAGFFSVFREMKACDDKHDLFQRLDFRLLHSLELSTKLSKMSFEERYELIKGTLFAVIKMVETGFIRKHSVIEQRISSWRNLYERMKSEKEYRQQLESLDKQLGEFKSVIRRELNSKFPEVSDKDLSNTFKNQDNELTKFIAKYKMLKAKVPASSEADQFMAMYLELTEAGSLMQLNRMISLYDQCVHEVITTKLQMIKPVLANQSTPTSSGTSAPVKHSPDLQKSVTKAFLYEFCGREATDKIPVKKINLLDNHMYQYEPTNLGYLGKMLRSIHDKDQAHRWDAAHSLARCLSAANDFEKDYKRFHDFFKMLLNKQIMTEPEHKNIEILMKNARLINPLADKIKPLKKQISSLVDMVHYKELESSAQFKNLSTVISSSQIRLAPDELQYMLLLVAFEDQDCGDRILGMLALSIKLLDKVNNSVDLGQSSKSGSSCVIKV